MSLERIKKYCRRIAKAAKILMIIMLIIIVCQAICFLWQSLMPGKLNSFFNVFRIYTLFASNINNNALTLFELGSSLFNGLFVFLMLTVVRRMFLNLAETVSLSSITAEIKQLSLLLIADAIAVPLMRGICYTVFVKLPVPNGTLDLFPIAVGAILYFIAVILQSKAVLKENRE